MKTILGYQPRQIRKAIAGGLAPVVPLLAIAVTDLHISRAEAGGILGAAITGFAAVFIVKNHPAAADPDQG